MTPSDATVVLNGGAVLRHLDRRVDPITVPVVPFPPVPTGTRDVTITGAQQNLGDFGTVNNLSLRGTATVVQVPPGTYGTLSATGGAIAILGHTGAGTASTYNLQGLMVDGNSRVILAGPVEVTVAGAVAVKGPMGSSEHPDWLLLQLASGGVSVNARLWGNIVAIAD